MSVEEQIKDIVARIVHVDKGVLSREGTFKDIQADSLDIVQAMVAIEEAFDIEIPDEEAQEFKNLGDLVDYVESHASGKEKV
ncbi:MAG: acyl carrier protein [Dehalococcoidia bacterium]|nr:acyl carrier protein [Dehalococcoidia bacterium]